MKGNFGDAASYLVEKGANANDVYVDEGGDRHSLLMDAIIVENVPFAELLVKHGADVNVTDEQGVTTLIQVRRRPFLHRYLQFCCSDVRSMVPMFAFTVRRAPVQEGQLSVLRYCCTRFTCSCFWCLCYGKLSKARSFLLQTAIVHLPPGWNRGINYDILWCQLQSNNVVARCTRLNAPCRHNTPIDELSQASDCR